MSREASLPYDAKIKAQQARGVALSTSGAHTEALAELQSGADKLYTAQTNPDGVSGLTVRTHLAGIIRDIALTELRQAGTSWERPEQRDNDLHRTEALLGDSLTNLDLTDTHPLAPDYQGHLKAERAATQTALGRCAGLQVLATREIGGNETPLVTKMDKHFTEARTLAREGNNTFYEVNGLLVEASYRRVIEGRVPKGLIRQALRAVISRPPSKDTIRAAGSMVKRLPEFRTISPENLRAHI